MKVHDCVFCMIVDGKIPSTKIFENEKVLAFKDLRPLADIHYLVVHKNHTNDVNDIVSKEPSQFSEIFDAIKEITEKEKLVTNGFRVVANTGPDAGQTVFHTHFHLLAGEQLRGFGR